MPRMWGDDEKTIKQVLYTMSEEKAERIAIMMESGMSEEEALKWYELSKLDVNLHDFLAGTDIEEIRFDKS